MAEFATWLWQRRDVDAALKSLQEFLFTERARWVEPPDSAELYSGAILAHAPAASQQALLQAFARWWGEWQATRSKGSGFWAVIERRPWLVTLVIIVAVFSVFIYRGFNGTFLAALADTAQARGLITYFFALATIGVAITCAVATFIVPASQIDERVAKAKDVLTVLIGVLGTIIGFYFGSQGFGGAPLRIAEATPSLATAAPGGKVTIAATVRGGRSRPTATPSSSCRQPAPTRPSSAPSTCR